MSTTSLLARSALAAATLLLAAGCGDDGADTAEDSSGDTPASRSPSADGGTDLPACADVWVAGETLPRGYRGCEEDGAVVKADKHPCSYGAHIVEYADRFYAVTGKQINEVPSLAASDRFRQALTACQG